MITARRPVSRHRENKRIKRNRKENSLLIVIEKPKVDGVVESVLRLDRMAEYSTKYVIKKHTPSHLRINSCSFKTK
jgi:hypothetical protein